MQPRRVAYTAHAAAHAAKYGRRDWRHSAKYTSASRAVSAAWNPRALSTTDGGITSQHRQLAGRAIERRRRARVLDAVPAPAQEPTGRCRLGVAQDQAHRSLQRRLVSLAAHQGARRLEVHGLDAPP